MKISLPKASFFFFFSCFFGKHNSRPDLTSHWQPEVKLIGRGGPAGVSPAHHWVWTWTVPSSFTALKFYFSVSEKEAKPKKKRKEQMNKYSTLKSTLNEKWARAFAILRTSRWGPFLSLNSHSGALQCSLLLLESCYVPLLLIFFVCYSIH
jgi:hypothetical protein